MPITISGGVQLSGPVTLGPGAGAAPTPGAENYGYSAGGPNSNMIQKFSLSSDGNGIDVGNLPANLQQVSAVSSATNGYTMGGYDPGIGGATTSINKFPFVSDDNAANVASLSLKIRMTAPTQSITNGVGYVAGGYSAVPFPSSVNDRSLIQKFVFATENDATDIGDLTVSRYHMAGTSSTTHGYAAGGSLNPGQTNIIDKYPFTSDTSATDVGDLTVSNARNCGAFSNTHGYSQGGNPQAIGGANIEKFSFASDGNATHNANLYDGSEGGAGISSKTNGYMAGGEQANYNVIQKYPFASDDDSTDVGDLIGTKNNSAAGAQY